MKLYFVRHPETEFNKKKLVQGSTDSPITKRGMQQLKKLTLRLRKEDFDEIISSPSIRALTTAETINKYHNLKIKVEPLIRERDYGIYEGKKESSCIWETVNAPWHLLKPKNGESPNDVFQRAKKFLQKIKNSNHEKILVSSHGRILSMIFGILKNLKIEKTKDIKPKNTSLTIVELKKDGTAKFLLFDSVKHLK